MTKIGVILENRICSIQLKVEMISIMHYITYNAHTQKFVTISKQPKFQNMPWYLDISFVSSQMQNDIKLHKYKLSLYVWNNIVFKIIVSCDLS